MGLASSRRGLSEVIAALLVISITISAGTLFAVYASGLMGNILKPTSQPYTEQLTLDYYNWPLSSTGSCCSNLVITIRNDGAAKVTLSDFFIQGVQVSTPTTGSNCPSSSPISLTVQSTCTLTFPVTTVTSGVAYIVKLVANDGTIFTFSCVAGSYTH